MAKLILWLIMPLYMWGVTITEDTTLSGDVVYNEDVIVDGAILKLNNYTLTVNGDLNITGANARLQMTETDDKLVVKGNLTFAGASTYQDLTKGVIELAGNFYQKGTETSYDVCCCSGGSTLNVTGCGARYRANNAYSFYPTDKHKVILNGTTKQIVDFEAPSYSRFNHLEIQNSSADGVVFEQLNVIGEWKRNSNQVTMTDIRNLTLTEDYTISNDIDIVDGELNLNGFNLTINGNMNSKSARVNINNSTLIIDNDLTFIGSNSRLQMTKLNDKVIVKGNLIFNGASTYQDLTNGVIELAGNFYQKGTETSYDVCCCSGGSTLNVTGCGARYRSNNAYSFYPTDKHKVILNGTTKQIVDFEAPSYSRFNHLEIQNSSADGVVFEQLNIIGEWKRNSNQVTITDIRNLKLTEDYTIPNNIDIVDGVLDLNGFNLTINGDMNSKSARLNINNSTLTIDNDLTFTGSNSRLQMTKPNDKVIIKGNLIFAGASTYQDLTNGVIELAGNFYQKGTETSYDVCCCSGGSTLNVIGCGARYRANNAYSFYPTNNHKVILNGTGQQILDFEAPDSSQFANLEISNTTVDIDLESGKKLKVIGDLYLDESLYNSTYKDNEFITYSHYRDIRSTYMTIYRGLNLIALPIKTTITESQIYTIFSDQNISHVLKYDSDSQQWQGFGNSEVARKKIADNGVAQLNSIRAGEGFFVKAESEVELKFPRGEEYGIESININRLSSGWHLLGTNRLIELDKLLKDNRNIKLLWRYSQNKWSFLSNDNEIQDEYRRREILQSEDTNATNSGFWIYIE